jgi:hypothetical protein
MLKITGFMCLMIVSGSTLADWEEAVSDDEVKTYADSSTIIKKGDKVKMWSLQDYADAQSADDLSYLSVKNINEYDCKRRQIKQLYVSRHDENMGEGDILFINYEPEKWQTVEADSAEESLLKVACGEKTETDSSE